MSMLDAITSKKGAALVAPAILLLGAALAIGQNQEEVAAAEPAVKIAAVEPAAKAAPTEPAPKAAATEAAPSAQQPAPAAQKSASAISPAQRKEIEAIIKDYLLKNPEVLMEAQNALEAAMDKIAAERTAAAIKANSAEIFRPAGSPIVGNVKGDVTVIEFFDYNCGFCKKAFTELAQLVDKDKKVKVILKEFPILSKASEETSRVALAAKAQGKYWEFHRGVLESQGQANEASALKIAEKLGLDMTRLKKDMASNEVKKEIEDTRKLAGKLGIQGTPHFLVGDRIVPGAPENLYEQLSKHVADVRKEGCKVC
jgi:protein-disulfide isomerase